MMHVYNLDMITMQQVESKYQTILDNATMSDVAAGGAWYANAKAIAHDLSATSGYSLEVTASVISAFSPLTAWSHNVVLATQFLSGNRVATLPNSIATAERALTMGFGALNGAKTHNFARNIAGDMHAVTIDRHMLSAAGLPIRKPGKALYATMTDAVRNLAVRHAIEPAQVQAIIWVAWRGGAD